MVVNPNPISFDSGRAVNRWLDRWAGSHLRDPDDWQQVLDLTREWSDYSPRNQLLLASYRATGPVAGLETWQLVPSSDGVSCAVRSGEHALPIRVPVTTNASEPDPHLGGVRPTQAAVAGWEWRGVFCLDQLVRRPDPSTLTRDPVEVSDEGVQRAVVAAARRTLRGPMADADDSTAVLAAAAGRMSRNSKRVAPIEVLAVQVGQLVLSRVGRPGELPAFDPGPLEVRERWESLLDVLDVERRLSAAVGRQLDLDLLKSPLPRMAIEDDRAVPARRRNRLPRASVEQLPLGRWLEVGPYTGDEWAARGETANGKGVYRRLNSTAYLVVIEQGDRASWRLEDTRSKVGAGRLDGGVESDLTAARAAALETLRHRYPQLASDLAERAVDDVPAGWEPVESHPGAIRQTHHGRVTTFVIPSEGGWLPVVHRHTGGAPEIGPLSASRDDATAMATKVGRRALREAVLEVRVDFDADLAEYATSANYDSQGMVERVAPRLALAEQTALGAGPDPSELSELLGAAGVTAETTVAVLRAEDATAKDVAPLLPMLGIAPAEGIGELHRRWGIARIEAAELVEATAVEMRAAGCGPDEILEARPRDLLAGLPADPALWDLAGGALSTRHTPDEVAGFLSSHAPNSDCFATGLVAAVDDSTLGLGLAASRGMPVEAIAACSERYGLSPAETAQRLAESGVSTQVAVDVVRHRCDGDPVLTTQIVRSEMSLRTEAVVLALTNGLPTDDHSAVREQVRDVPSLSNDRSALLTAHRTPVPAALAQNDRYDTRRLLAALPQPEGTPASVGRDALLAALPEPRKATAASLLDALPEPDLSLSQEIDIT